MADLTVFEFAQDAQPETLSYKATEEVAQASDLKCLIPAECAPAIKSEDSD